MWAFVHIAFIKDLGDGWTFWRLFDNFGDPQSRTKICMPISYISRSIDPYGGLCTEYCLRIASVHRDGARVWPHCVQGPPDLPVLPTYSGFLLIRDWDTWPLNLLAKSCKAAQQSLRMCATTRVVIILCQYGPSSHQSNHICLCNRYRRLSPKALCQNWGRFLWNYLKSCIQTYTSPSGLRPRPYSRGFRLTEASKTMVHYWFGCYSTTPPGRCFATSPSGIPCKSTKWQIVRRPVKCWN